MSKIWDPVEVEQMYNSPFVTLLHKAQSIHQENFIPNKVQLSTLLSIKTGSCPEDCAYCPQSGKYNTKIQKERLIDIEKVKEKAKAAKACGATRFCMGAGWRNPSKRDLPKVIEMIKAVKELGMETCVTLGMLTTEQAQELKEAGLDYYNHNLDTSRRYYKEIITTRTYDDRLETLENVRKADINVCCGGIMGMGETREDRVDFLLQLANQDTPPESVPINKLMAMEGTPLGDQKPEIDNFEFIRTVAIARIMMPTSFVRLSAGRDNMSEEMQALCFMAGANSIFFGDKLLTASNPSNDRDVKLLEKLGINA